jgi:hypothetical protein
MIQAPRILLLGDPGSGKTDSLPTVIPAGLELFVIITEPGGVESLLDSCDRRKIPIDKLHWKVISPTAPGLKALHDIGVIVKALSYKDLAEVKQGVGKSEMKGWEEILANMANFHCDRTNRNYGDVTDWSDDRALAFDSMSGLNLICMHHVVGHKTTPHQGEWGTAMGMEEQLVLKFTSDCRCLFILTGHIDREFDTVLGATRLAPAALGSKLGPRIPRFFSEVVRARREGTSFFWSTADIDIALKNRALPISSKIVPDFAPIIEVYRRRKIQAQARPLIPEEIGGHLEHPVAH